MTYKIEIITLCRCLILGRIKKMRIITIFSCNGTKTQTYYDTIKNVSKLVDLINDEDQIILQNFNDEEINVFLDHLRGSIDFDTTIKTIPEMMLYFDIVSFDDSDDESKFINISGKTFYVKYSEITEHLKYFESFFKHHDPVNKHDYTNILIDRSQVLFGLILKYIAFLTSGIKNGRKQSELLKVIVEELAYYCYDYKINNDYHFIKIMSREEWEKRKIVKYETRYINNMLEVFKIKDKIPIHVDQNIIFDQSYILLKLNNISFKEIIHRSNILNIVDYKKYFTIINDKLIKIDNRTKSLELIFDRDVIGFEFFELLKKDTSHVTQNITHTIKIDKLTKEFVVDLQNIIMESNFIITEMNISSYEIMNFLNIRTIEFADNVFFQKKMLKENLWATYDVLNQIKPYCIIYTQHQNNKMIINFNDAFEGVLKIKLKGCPI